MSETTADQLIKLGKTINAYFSASIFFTSELGFSPFDCLVLRLIHDNPNKDEYSLQELAHDDSIAIRRAIRKLGRAGFVTISAPTGYATTTKGVALVEELDDIQLKISTYLGEKIPPEDAAEVTHAIKNILEILASN